MLFDCFMGCLYSSFAFLVGILYYIEVPFGLVFLDLHALLWALLFWATPLPTFVCCLFSLLIHLFNLFFLYDLAFSDSWFWQYRFKEHASWALEQYRSSYISFNKLYCSPILWFPFRNRCKIIQQITYVQLTFYVVKFLVSWSLISVTQCDIRRYIVLFNFWWKLMMLYLISYLLI